MNKELIDQLIESRNKLTNVRDEVIRYDLVDFIDAQLAQVPAGEDNRVDLLLGRQCAVLPVRPDIIDSINFSEEHQYLHCHCGYDATGLIDGIKHQSECNAVKPGWIVNPVVTIAQMEQARVVFESVPCDLTSAEIAEMEARCAETTSEAPMYDGMWK